VTEQREYVVVAERGPVELRRYAACTVADVTVRGSAERAAYAGFGPLVSYISSANLAMTAPVLQQAVAPEGGEAAGALASATVRPVADAGALPDEWTVSFVLPVRWPGQGSYPRPADARVSLRDVPEHLAAAVRFSGRWSDASVRKHTDRLLAAVAAYGWTAVGAPQWARYDPPWKPWFARRNEVIVEVQVPA
jgi:hypothetical protein